MNAGVPRYAPPIKIFFAKCYFKLEAKNIHFKRKKEKKESHSSSGGFQKSKFFLKNTTTLIRPLEVGICCLVEKLFWERMGGGDFLKNPQGLNLLFCKPGTYLCSLFFILFFWSRSRIFFWGRIFLLQSWGRLARVSNFGAGKKTKSQL